MNNLPGLIIATLVLIWLPAEAQAKVTKQDKKVIHSSRTAKLKAGGVFQDCSGCPQMVVVPAGSYEMGSPETEAGRGKDESPVHQVKVSTFALGSTEITRKQFAAFVKNTHYKAGEKCWIFENGKFENRDVSWRQIGNLQDDKQPVGCISWNDASAYTKWLSRKTGKKYRLPSEAEWEYAARGDTQTARYWGDDADRACLYSNGADKTAHSTIQGATSWNVHNCTDNFAYTSPVGSFKANAYGLYDMLGNLWEWTEDSYHINYIGAPNDGSPWQGDGISRVLRGGSWNNGPRNMRSAVRDRNKPDLRFSIFGFRLARELP
ncbi:MAG: formylglycine-generating enzyme family protein [Gallionellaceae bacterium]